MPILPDISIPINNIIGLSSGPGNSNGKIQILNGNWSNLSSNVRQWIEEKVNLCAPDSIYIMDGSVEEDRWLKTILVSRGVIIPLPKYENCFYARTDPRDVARVESKTFIATDTRIQTIPDAAPGVKGTLGNWIAPAELDGKVKELFNGCMKGRTMYVIPYSMGPVGSPLSKIGIELTDSAYVAISMRVMTRVGSEVMRILNNNPNYQFVKCLHSVGQPLQPGEKSAIWPCNPEKTIIAHKPEFGEIISFGSGYGGNSLLGKKCFALRLGSALAQKEGWLAEHMLIMGVQEHGSNKKRYITAAFPSACGKTNLALLQPKIPGYTVTCVGDDIAWLRFDQSGKLRAINPENGFFGVAPGTSDDSNPIAMQTIFKDTLFTNVALTLDGGVWWEGMSKAPSHLIDWKGQEWTPDCGRPAAHPNSRFCSPAKNCPSIDQDWENPNGVPIDAILFGGRRPTGVPLVAESFNWKHGVFMGASLKSEATAAAEHRGKMVMHDPFSMRPFFGYNFGHYLEHWLSFADKPGLQLPKIFMINWFRKSVAGGFLWPGFGENIRVVDWILRRCDGEPNIGRDSEVGVLPANGSLFLKGLKENVDIEACFSVPKQFWLDEVEELRQYFNHQVGSSLPQEITQQLNELYARF